MVEKLKIKKWLPLVAIMVIAGGLYAFTFDKKLDLSGDNVKYFLLGKSLADGTGYTSIWQPDTPVHTHFPPGYPAIISLAMKLGLKSVVAVKQLNFIFLIFATLILYRIAREFASNFAAWIASLLFIANSILLHYSSIMMSEVPYIYFTLLTIYLVVLGSKQREQKSQIVFFATAMLAAVMAYFVRGMGVSLFLTLLIFFSIQKRWVWSAITSSVWTILSLFTLESQNGYLHTIRYRNIYQMEQGVMELSDYVNRIILNGVRYLCTEIPRIFMPYLSPLHPTWSGALVGIVAVALMVTALFRLRHLQPLLISYLFVNFGILLLWPEQWYGERFLLPMYAILIVLVVHGLERITQLIPQHKYILLALAIIYLELHSPMIWNNHKIAKASYPVNWQGYFYLANWARQHTNPDDVFATRKEGFFYLFSGRRALRYKFTPQDQAMIADFEENDVKYVLVENLGFSSTDRYLLPTIENNPKRFSSVCFVNMSRTHLYQFNR